MTGMLRRASPVLLGMVLVLLALWVMLVVYLLASPLYVLKGPVTGRVALLWYELWFFDERIGHPALDAIQVYCYVLVLGIVFGAEGLAIAAYSVLRRQSPTRTLGGFIVASSLVVLVASGAARGIVTLVSRIVMVLARNYTYTTSAGTLVFPLEVVTRGYSLFIVESGLLLLVSTLAVLASIAWYIATYWE